MKDGVGLGIENRSSASFLVADHDLGGTLDSRYDSQESHPAQTAGSGHF
jgi:hypothetical protein